MKNKTVLLTSILIIGLVIVPRSLFAGDLSCSIYINNGDTYTNLRSVTLNVFASGGEGKKYMSFCNDNDSWSSWESFDTSKSWILADNKGKDGIRTVNIAVKDSSSTPNYDFDNDSIILDRKNPFTFLSFSEEEGDNGWYISVNATLESSDATSGVKYTKYKYGENWKKNYSDEFSFDIPDGASRQLKYYSVDNAGNEEIERSTDTKKIDGTDPETSISLSGTKGDNEWYTSNVTVSLSASDATSGINWTKYRIGYFGDEKTYSNPFILSDEGETELYYRSRDIAGNDEWPENRVVIKIDKTEPDVPIMEDEPISGYTPGNSNTISWNAVSDNISGNVKYFVQCDDNKDFSSPYAQSDWIPGTSYTFINLEDETEYWYRVKAKDEAGNVSDWSDNVSSIQDATDPTITITGPEDGYSSDEYKVSKTTVVLSDNLWCYKVDGNVNGYSTKVTSISFNSVITSTNPTVDVEVDEGMNNITLTVEDRAGNTASQSIQVTYGIYTSTNFKFHYTTSDKYPIKVDSYYYRDDHVDNTDTNGNRIPDYVDNFASIFENVWDEETVFMGRKPNNGYYKYKREDPFDSKYNVYIINVGEEDIYGFAQGFETGASYIAVDNDYTGFSGNPLKDMRVTAAHEFFHAIQFKIDVNEDHWWKEATAVWMEDEVYDGDDDYLQYFQDGRVGFGWFRCPETSLDFVNRWHEYGSCIFAKYLSENHGRNIIKDIWDDCAGSVQSLEAIQNTLGGSDDFEENFKNFTYWNYDKENYEEQRSGRLYDPYPTKIEIIHSSYPIKTETGSIDHLASNYIEFLPDPNIPTDDKTTQNLYIKISSSDTDIWGGKVLKVDRSSDVVVDVVDLESGDDIDIKGLGSNSTDEYGKVVFVLSNTNVSGSTKSYCYDAFTSAVKYDSSKVIDPSKSTSSPKIVYSVSDLSSEKSSSEEVEDYFGNNDGNIDAGESPNITVTLKNLGSTDIENATAIITPDSKSGNYIFFGSFNEDSYSDTMTRYGGTSTGDRGFWSDVDPDTPLGQDLHFSLDITDQYGIKYDDEFTVNVDIDINLTHVYPSKYDGNKIENGEWGNNNGDADAGELLAVPVSLLNEGYSNIRRDGYYQDGNEHENYNHNLVATLSTEDDYVKRIFDNSEKFEDILGRSFGYTKENYNFLIRSNAPSNHYIPFTLKIKDEVTDVDGNIHVYEWKKQFDIKVTGGDDIPPLIGNIDIVNVPNVPILKEGEKLKFNTNILDGSDKVSREVNILYPDNSEHLINVDRNSPVWNGYYEKITDYWQLPESTGTLEDGTYSAQNLKADDGYGNMSSKEISKEIEIDTELPIADLPEFDNKYVHKVVNIVGSATDVHFDWYRLYYAKGKDVKPESDLWTLLIESDSAVEDDVLCEWDTTNLEEGDYTLKLVVQDEVEHSNCDLINVIVDNTPPEISNTYASPFVFTPEDNDGFRDITTLYGGISDTLSPEITFRVNIIEREERTFVVNLIGETTQAKNFSIVWDGENEDGEFVMDGLYYFNITGIDLAGNERTVNVPMTKNRAPSRIDSPEEGEEVGDIVNIMGLAVDYIDFKNFIIDYAKGTYESTNEDLASWISIPVPVINQAKADPKYPYSNISVIQCNEGVLANWDTIGLDDGEYTIRLKVNDYSGDVQKVFKHVKIKNPLYLYDVNPNNEFFSPNGDGIQDMVKIKYCLSEEADVNIKVLDSSGTVRKNYFTEKNLSKGEYTVVWDGTDSGGEIVEDGEYSINIVADAADPFGGSREENVPVIVNNFQQAPDLTAAISLPADGSDVQTTPGIHYSWEAEGEGRKYPDQNFDYIITAVGSKNLPSGGNNTERVHLHKKWSIDHQSKWGSFDIYLKDPEKYRNRGPVQWKRKVIKSKNVEYVRHTAYDDHLHIYAKVYSNFWGAGCYKADYEVWAQEKSVSWTRSQSGTGKVNALEEDKLIDECNLTAPNKDTRWFLWHNNSNVGAWMKDNKLYATTGVSELWSTVKVKGEDNIFELNVSSQIEEIEYVPPANNVRVDRWKVNILDDKDNENKDVVVESIDNSKKRFVAEIKGNPTPRSLVKIRGTAASPNLKYYRIDCELSNDNSWATVKKSNRQVVNGTLAVWDVTDLKEGAYTVLLTVVDKVEGVKQIYNKVNLNIPLVITCEEPEINPFSPQYEKAKLRFNLSEKANITAKIKEGTTTVKEIVKEKLMKLGTHELEWDGRDSDENIVPDGTYCCKVIATDTDLDVEGNPLEQVTESISNVQVKFENKKLDSLDIIANPNPFSPDKDGVKDSVNITYNLSEKANVKLLIKNSSGIVRNLIDNLEEPQGIHLIKWDGKLVDETTVASAGKYTCWIEATSFDDPSDIRQDSIELTLQGTSTSNITAQILEPTNEDVIDRTSSNAGTFFTYKAEGIGTKYPEQDFSYTIKADGTRRKRDKGSRGKTDERVCGHRDKQFFDGDLWTNQDVHEYTMKHVFSPSFLTTPNVNSYSSNGVAASNPWWSDEDTNFCWKYKVTRDKIVLKTFAFEDMDGCGWHGTSNPTFWWSVSGTIKWSSSESGSGEVSAVDGHKQITSSNLRAPNNDTSWSVTDNSDTVITWMEGNKLYARVDTTKPGTVISNWSTDEIYSREPNILIFDTDNPDVIPYLNINVFDVYNKPSDVEFESWDITPLNMDGSVNNDVKIENIDAVNGTFDAKLSLKEQRKFLRIEGTAEGEDFKSYTLEYGQGSEPDEWNLIKTSLSSVLDGTLAYWDISRLYGTYTILLTVEDIFGNVKEIKRNIQIGELVTRGINDFVATPYEETHLYFSPDTLPPDIEDNYPLTSEKDALVSAIPIAPDDVPEDPNIVIVGPVFDFKPSGLSFNDNYPVTLNSQYTKERLIQMVGDVDPSKLGIYQFYPDGNVEYRPGFVDKETQRVSISAQLSHFSEYIMALDLTPPGIPVLDPVKSPTNNKLIKLTGKAQPETTIEIFNNGKSQGKISTDNQGKFSLAAVELKEGDNLITAVATNKKDISSKPASISVTLDRLTPVFVTADASPKVFSPNADGVDDLAGIKAEISKPGSVNYTVFDSSGRVVLIKRLETDKENNTYFSWDGHASSGEMANEGIYSYHISAIDDAGNKASESSFSNGNIKLDTTPPEIFNVSCKRSSFSPDGDGFNDKVSIDYEIKDNLCNNYYLTVRIYDDSGNLVRLLKNNECLHIGTNSIAWDGNDEMGNVVNDGTYVLKLDFVDDAGNMGKEGLVSVNIDNASVLDFSKTKVKPKSISPDNNSKKDSCSISFTLLSPAKVTLKIFNPETMDQIKDLIVNEDFDKGSYKINWEGKSNQGDIVADGIYKCKLSATSQAGKESRVTMYINVDKTPPVAKISQPSFNATLSGIIDVIGTAEDENYSGYSLTYGQGASTEEWTPIFSSSRPVANDNLARWDTAGLSGTYTIRLNAIDDAGNKTEDDVSFNLDNPEKYIVKLMSSFSNLFSPNGDGIKDKISIIYSLKEDARMGLWVYDENNMVRTLLDGTTTQISGYNGVRWDGKNDSEESLSDGTYNYKLQAVSVSDGFKDERSGNIIIDTLSPSANITSPKEGDIVGGMVEICGEANDDAFNEYRIEYRRGDSPQEWKELKISAVPVSDGRLSYFDTSEIENGIYTIRLIANDRAGNNATDKVSIKVNNSPVVALIETPVRDEVINGEIKIIGTVQAPNLDYYQVEYSTNYSTYKPITEKINASVDKGLLATWDTSTISGDCSLRLTVKDKSGRSKSSSVSFRIDNEPPEVEIKSPEELSSVWGTVNIVGTAKDDNLVRYSLEYKNSDLDSAWQTIGTYTTPIYDDVLGFWNTEGLNGDYLISIKAADIVNNTASMMSKISVDNMLPIARIDGPGNNSVLKGKLSILGEANGLYFEKYCLSYAKEPSFDEWKSIRISTIPVKNGILTEWDTKSLNGTYCVKLIVHTSNGKVNEDKVVVFVDNTAPIITRVTTNPLTFDPNNPKANFTTINYTLSEEAKVTLNILDNDGNLIKHLIPSSFREEGMNSSVWDGKDNSKEKVAYGEYIYEIAATDSVGNLSDKANGTINLSPDLAPATSLSPSGPIYSDKRGRFAPMSYTYTLTGINTDDVSQVDRTEFSIDNSDWETYTSPLYFNSEGEHLIKYKSVDTNKNWEKLKEFRVIVDSTPPKSQIKISRPYLHSGMDNILYVNSGTGFELMVGDQGTIPSGIYRIDYRINGDKWQEYADTFNLAVADGSYNLEYRATDKVQNVEDSKSLQFIMDDTPPVTSIVVNGPQYSDDKSIWVSSSNLVSFSAEDSSGCGVNFTRYKIGTRDEEIYKSSFTFSNEGSHVIAYKSEDNIGNIEKEKITKIIVDKDAPTVEVHIKGPLFGTNPVYISSQTFIVLTGQDNNGCGIDNINYSLNEGKTWIVYSSSFTIDQSGMVSVQYNGVDRVNNKGDIETINVFVDKTPPETTLIPSEPLYKDLYASLSTIYIFNAKDPEVSGGASRIAKIKYQIDGGELMEYKNAFGLSPGKHDIKYYAVDNVFNVENIRSFDVIVDTASPSTNVIPSGELYQVGSKYFAPLFYTYTLSANQGISGVDYIKFSIDSGDWETYSNPISFSTGGEHEIRYKAKSNTGKWEEEKKFKVFVDATPPEVVDRWPSNEEFVSVSDVEKIVMNFTEKVFVDNDNWSKAVSLVNSNSKKIVSGKISYDDSSHKLCFEPDSELNYNCDFEIKLSPLIKDSVGNRLKKFVSRFTTIMDKDKGGEVSKDELTIVVGPDALCEDGVIRIEKEKGDIINRVPKPLTAFSGYGYNLFGLNRGHKRIREEVRNDIEIQIDYSRIMKRPNYTKSTLTENLDINTLNIFYYDEKNEIWQPIKNSDNDVNNKVVSAKIDRFGKYAVMGFSPPSESLKDLSCFPNPFPAFGRDYTTIQYYLKEDAKVDIVIYDLLGNPVRKYEFSEGVSGKSQGGIENQVKWNGKNGNGDLVANGGYICIVKMDTGDKTKIKRIKILVVK